MLRQYLSNGPALPRLELLKLWKGLFYYKPLVQQALANDLGSLIMDMPTDNAVPFLAAFWEIHCKEWAGLDRHRLDKYYLLFRRVIYFSFQFLAREEWNEELVNAYGTMLLEGPLHPKDRTKPDAIQYHIIDLYFEELEKVLDDLRAQLDEDEEEKDLEVPMEALTRPLTVLSTDAVNKVTRKKAKEAIHAHEEEMKAMKEDAEDEEEDAEEDDDAMEEDA
ncbi:uncharacterized protein BYT42DRAFT_595329 [Radiomyces spectabilis]|uniref:uncharacterized protein n=1 Tax=Radiomyces spectabilis TaxID=64574 RepID=UPI002220D771|nr:uncharacterized protein BYT42DRAFT_595329 [Radiomyces spectabilis]KAI8370660.1 hypothetical protein BYT42DRAFT_595329 [Radiomyces spectabilis]